MELDNQIEKNKEALRDHMSEVQRIQKTLQILQEKKLELSEDYFRGVCINCDGKQWVKKGETKQQCPLCRGNGYIWIKKYKDE